MYPSTLRPCSVGLAPSSGLLLASRPPRRSTLRLALGPHRTTLPLALGPGGRNSLKFVNPRSCQAAAGWVVRARTAADQKDSAEIDYEFPEERNKIQDYLEKTCNAGALRSEETASGDYLCMIAENSVRLASVVMSKPRNISLDTLPTKLMNPTKHQKLVLHGCVRTFVHTAKDAYHDKVTKGTIVSFLRALEHLAAISFFVAQDTLANVGEYKVISPKYRPEFDEYMRKMDTLKHDLNIARPDEDMVLRNIVTDAMSHTEPFVMSMTDCRTNALLGLALGVSTAAAV
ncbi:unnamed protein product [Alopecurus aequalis]